MAERVTEALVAQPPGAVGDDHQLECEQVVQRLWLDLFGSRPGVGEGNFFELGGDSAMAVQLVQRIAERFDITLHVVRVFQHPTAHELTQVVRRALAEHAALSSQDDGSDEVLI